MKKSAPAIAQWKEIELDRQVGLPPGPLDSTSAVVDAAAFVAAFGRLQLP